jgi:hypothetical protein
VFLSTIPLGRPLVKSYDRFDAFCDYKISFVTTKVKPVPSGHNETLLPDTAPNCPTIFFASTIRLGDMIRQNGETVGSVLEILRPLPRSLIMPLSDNPV